MQPFLNWRPFWFWCPDWISVIPCKTGVILPRVYNTGYLIQVLGGRTPVLLGMNDLAGMAFFGGHFGIPLGFGGHGHGSHHG